MSLSSISYENFPFYVLFIAIGISFIWLFQSFRDLHIAEDKYYIKYGEYFDINKSYKNKGNKYEKKRTCRADF